MHRRRHWPLNDVYVLAGAGIAAIGVLIFASYDLQCIHGGDGAAAHHNHSLLLHLGAGNTSSGGGAGGSAAELACAIVSVNSTTPVPPLHGNADRILGYTYPPTSTYLPSYLHVPDLQ